jgi:predicted nucleic acid-binding protein
MRIALDTNILAYAEGANGLVMRDRALDLPGRLPQGAIALPVQTLGELFNVLVRSPAESGARAGSRVELVRLVRHNRDVRCRND